MRCRAANKSLLSADCLLGASSVLPRGHAEYANFRGADNVTHEDIVREVKPQGRAKVPDSLKAELLRKIRDVLES